MSQRLPQMFTSRRPLARAPLAWGRTRFRILRPPRQSAAGVSSHPALPAMGGTTAGTSVLVVFVDHTACWWLRLLRPGFRHCFVVLGTGRVWLACEPLKDRIELTLLDLPHEFDLARFYHEQGHRVLSGRRPQPGPMRRFTLALVTCVTVVKRVLAIDAPGVWTPSQLYAHLSDPGHGFVEFDRDSTAVPMSTQASSACANLGA